MADHLCSVDYDEEMAFAAVVGSPEHERIVATSSYYRDPLTPSREVAYMVEPEWPRSGMATALHARTVEYARSHGVRGFTADVLMSKPAMLKVFRRGVGHTRRMDADAGVYEVKMTFTDDPGAAPETSPATMSAHSQVPAAPERRLCLSRGPSGPGLRIGTIGVADRHSDDRRLPSPASKEETMQSNNPVFRNSSEFNGQTSNAYGNQVYGGSGATHQGYGTSPDPSSWSVGTPGATQAATGPMTVDSVVQKTGLALLVVVVTAFATWVLTPGLGDADSTVLSDAALSQLYGAMTIGGLTAFGLSMVNSFKRVISPALVLAFCAAEGVALGAFSKFFDYQYGGGIVIQAVIGTFAAFAGTLAAYRFFDIQVSNKFRMGVIAAVFGMVGLGILEMVLGLFGSGLGVYGFGVVGFLFSVVGLVLGIFMLILDFDFVENGIRAGLPERESWRAAFGLTVSLVWIYTNLLRILAIMRR